MMVRYYRTIIAGLAGGFAFNVSMFLTFRLIGFGLNGEGILLDPSIQSKKLIAVWIEMEPLPMVVMNPIPIMTGLFLLCILHAFIYSSISMAWPEGIRKRGLRFGALIFIFSFLFWEFFTPFNQFGEPLRLILLELLFWAVIAFSEAFAIAWVMEPKKISL